MSRQLVVASLVTLMLIGVGYLLQRWLVTSDTGQVQYQAPTPDARAPELDARLADASEVKLLARVMESKGRAERKSPEGDWQPINVGVLLQLDDVLRTGRNGSLAIQLGDTEIRMDPATTITVSALSRVLSEVRLGVGRIEADVPEDSAGRLGIGLQNGDLYAETDAGQFAVAVSDRGDATVTSRKGSVQVQAAGESVRVNSGQQTLIRRQKAPTQPGEIPTSLFVKINQHKKVHGKKRFVLRGRTSPGAMVTIQGKQVLADARGHYSSIVALREGANRIRIRTVDGLGRRKSIETNIERDSTGPDVSGDVKWGHP